jgi:hypothetical protein
MLSRQTVVSCPAMSCHDMPCRILVWAAGISQATIDDRRSRHVLLSPRLEQLSIVLISAVVVERWIKLSIRVPGF